MCWNKSHLLPHLDENVFNYFSPKLLEPFLIAHTLFWKRHVVFFYFIFEPLKHVFDKVTGAKLKDKLVEFYFFPPSDILD